MKETFRDCKTPTDTIDIELREESFGNIIEVTIYEGSSSLIYLDKESALKMASSIIDMLAI